MKAATASAKRTFGSQRRKGIDAPYFWNLRVFAKKRSYNRTQYQMIASPAAMLGSTPRTRKHAEERPNDRKRGGPVQDGAERMLVHFQHPTRLPVRLCARTCFTVWPVSVFEL
jgi:hypothetical protein